MAETAGKGAQANIEFPSLSMSLSGQGAQSSGYANASEEAGRQRTKETALAFGTIVGAMMRSPRHRKMKLQDLEAAIVQPLILGQFVIAHAPVPNRPGESVPIAALWWALVSPEVDARLSKATEFPLLLHKSEWRCGEIPWIIDAAGQVSTLRTLIDEVGRQALGGINPKLPPTALI